MNNNNEQPVNQSPSERDTSTLGIISVYIALTSYIVLAICMGYLFYLQIRPCKYDRCEGIPFFEFLFILAVIFSIMSLLGGLLAFLAPKIDTEQRVQRRQQGLRLNFLLFGMCLLYIIFILVSIMT